LPFATCSFMVLRGLTPLSEHLSPLTVVLARLDDKAGKINTDVRSIMNVVQGPIPVPHEPIVKLLSDVRTEM